MTAPSTTEQAVESLRPNVYTFLPQDLIPDALIIAATTKVAEVEGDAPVAKAPYIDVGEAGFMPEGDEIPENELDSFEAVIATGKIAILTKISREQYKQTGGRQLLTDELKRAVIINADWALLTQAAPPAGKITPPPGLLNQDHTTGDEIEDNLDPVTDAITQIEAHSGTADLVIASPLSWAAGGQAEGVRRVQQVASRRR